MYASKFELSWLGWLLVNKSCSLHIHMSCRTLGLKYRLIVIYFKNIILDFVLPNIQYIVQYASDIFWFFWYLRYGMPNIIDSELISHGATMFKYGYRSRKVLCRIIKYRFLYYQAILVPLSISTVIPRFWTLVWPFESVLFRSYE